MTLREFLTGILEEDDIDRLTEEPAFSFLLEEMEEGDNL